MVTLSSYSIVCGTIIFRVGTLPVFLQLNKLQFELNLIASVIAFLRQKKIVGVVDFFIMLNRLMLLMFEI